MDGNEGWDRFPDTPAVRTWVSWLDSAEYPVPATPHLPAELLLDLAEGTYHGALTEESLVHLSGCARCISTLRAAAVDEPHLPAGELWALAAGHGPSDDTPYSREHLVSCARCAGALRELERGVEAGKHSNDIWNPEEYHAAAPGEVPPVLSDDTRDKRYRITFQRQGEEFDVLTVEVLPEHRAALEGRKIDVLAADGSLVVHGTISGGTIVRGHIPVSLRQKRPFWIQAAE